MMELYINGIFAGECESYEHSEWKDEKSGKVFPGWLFKMKNGKEYKISFQMIKLFTSSGKLEVVTIDGDLQRVKETVEKLAREATRNRIPVNNGRYKKVEPEEDGICIYTTDENGAMLEDVERISGKDFISMLNWYRYQKENGNPELLF